LCKLCYVDVCTVHCVDSVNKYVCLHVLGMEEQAGWPWGGARGDREGPTSGGGRGEGRRKRQVQWRRLCEHYHHQVWYLHRDKMRINKMRIGKGLFYLWLACQGAGVAYEELRIFWFTRVWCRY